MPIAADDPRLEGWYHTIELAPGVTNQGFYDHRPVLDRYGLPASLAGKAVLDVGPGTGFFAFEFERRGARVVALELPPDDPADWVPGAQRQFDRAHALHFATAHEILGSNVERRFGSIYDMSVGSTGAFDLVFCGSLLLHLLEPMRALTALRSVSREMLVIETAYLTGVEAAVPGEPLLRFGSWDIEEAQGLTRGAYRTYWRVTGPALKAMLEHAGFRKVELLPPFEIPPVGHHAIVAHAWI